MLALIVMGGMVVLTFVTLKWPRRDLRVVAVLFLCLVGFLREAMSVLAVRHLIGEAYAMGARANTYSNGALAVRDLFVQGMAYVLVPLVLLAVLAVRARN